MITQKQYENLCTQVQETHCPLVADLLTAFEELHAALDQALMRGAAHVPASSFELMYDVDGEPIVVLHTPETARAARAAQKGR